MAIAESLSLRQNWAYQIAVEMVARISATRTPRNEVLDLKFDSGCTVGTRAPDDSEEDDHATHSR